MEEKRTIIFATGNEGKLAEIRMILKDAPFRVLSMKEAGYHPEIEETGTTFAENAYLKAKTVMELSGQIAMADDSGLVIDYLDGAPGVYSARFMGEETPYEIKNRALIDALDGVPDEKRSARFVCAIACVLPDGSVLTSKGTMEGRIGYQIAGENGFGYDPIFYLPEYGCTSAQLTPDEKNEISHRGKALRLMRDRLCAKFL